MDGAAYLRKQGWRGDGHSLDLTNRGIRKPLLISKKIDVLGVGVKKHAAVSDQWWLRAYDSGLKSLGTGKESALKSVRENGVCLGGLYGRFVKGESVPGTFEKFAEGFEEESRAEERPAVEQQQNTKPKKQKDRVKMPVDKVPVDKLQRVVGNVDDENHKNAMMQMLQDPNKAPAGMQKMLDKKRKRAERPIEKRARRSVERIENQKQDVKRKREEAITNGTWDPAAEEEQRKRDDLNRRANEFVLEAQRQGIILARPNEIRKGLVPTGANAMSLSGSAANGLLDHMVAQQMSSTGKKLSLKAEKYAREKAKRDLKRTARAHLSGEKPPDEMTTEERKAAKHERKLKRAAGRADVQAKRQATITQREEISEKKAVRRKERKAQKVENTKRLAVIKEQNGDVMPPHLSLGVQKQRRLSSNGDDEIIPGVGAVDRYPTKAEKRETRLRAQALEERVSIQEAVVEEKQRGATRLAAEMEKVDAYRAAKEGLTLERYRQKLAEGDIVPPKDRAIDEKIKAMPADKVAHYRARAAEKGISVHDYVRHRKQKSDAREAESAPNPYQVDIASTAQKGAVEYIYAPHEPQPAQESAEQHDAGDLGFVLVVEGTGLATSSSSPSKPMAIIDTTGDTTLASAKHLPVPVDPSLWLGKQPKELTRPVRKARKQFIAQQRAEKKALKADNAAAAGAKNASIQKKSKGQRKIEAREAFVKGILHESRRALTSGTGDGMVRLNGVENVPLVRLETREGVYRKDEVGLARTVARRVLRNVKREERAKVGKGKGYKKRERSEKEVARNRGISGPTDRARVNVREAGDLLL